MCFKRTYFQGGSVRLLSWLCQTCPALLQSVCRHGSARHALHYYSLLMVFIYEPKWRQFKDKRNQSKSGDAARRQSEWEPRKGVKVWDGPSGGGKMLEGTERGERRPRDKGWDNHSPTNYCYTHLCTHTLPSPALVTHGQPPSLCWPACHICTPSMPYCSLNSRPSHQVKLSWADVARPAPARISFC